MIIVIISNLKYCWKIIITVDMEIKYQIKGLACCTLLLLISGMVQPALAQERLVAGLSDGVKIIDLTYEFSRETIYWVTSSEFEHDTVFVGRSAKGYYYTAFDFSSAEHGGTHLDAPLHFAEGRQSVEQIPLEHLMGSAVKIDLSARVADEADYLIGVADLQAWEKSGNIQIPEGSIVLLQTGFGRFYPDRKRYMGTEKRGEQAVRELHFPGLDPRAALWLVNERHIKAIGLDTPSIDYGQSADFESHVVLLSANVPVFENLANLHLLPEKGFEVIALPMKIKGGSGAPLRIIALLRE